MSKYKLTLNGLYQCTVSACRPLSLHAFGYVRALLCAFVCISVNVYVHKLLLDCISDAL